MTQAIPTTPVTLDVARLAGADFILNTAINRAKEPVAFFAGRIESAHFAGSQMVAKFSVIRMEEPADLVISSGEGAPMDTTFYQSTKGLVCTKNICRPGATVILSPNLDENQLRNCGLEKVNDLQDEVDRLCRVHSKVAVIPQGPYVVGLLI